MSLWPKCNFEVQLPQGALFAGARNPGSLILHVPEPIVRADHVELRFTSTATAGYGSGKQRSVVQRVLFNAMFRLPLPGSLAAGMHPLPFSLELPEQLPPAFTGDDYHLEHTFHARLDVDWAVDPVRAFAPVVVPARAMDRHREPKACLSPQHFHGDMVLEVMLPSAVLVYGEPLVGAIALRSGHDSKFAAIELELGSFARIVMGRADLRPAASSKLRIPADALRSGEPVPFTIEPHPAAMPTLHNAFIDHEWYLVVRADVPWAVDPAFDLHLLVLPTGSVVLGDTAMPILGGERLRRMASVMAREAGLHEGHLPLLVHGAVGPVTVKIRDAAGGEGLGIDVEYTFPDVELGIGFEPRGTFHAFRDSPLLPSGLDEYFLRVAVDEPALAGFFAQLIGNMPAARSIRLSDHHLSFHVRLPDDDPARMVALARAAKDRARRIRDAISQLPGPAAFAPLRALWERVAAEHQAFLVPSGPALHGLTIRARILGGEERAMGVTLRTVWAEAGPSLRADLDLASMPIPSKALRMLEGPDELLATVRATFAAIVVPSDGRSATLDAAAWTDPRVLLPAIEAFLFWAIAARGEHRSNAPYR